MAIQLEMFATEQHEHVYELKQGPHVLHPVIGAAPANRWCWSCSSWVNRVGVSQWEAWQVSDGELAMRYARMVKAGELGKHDAYWLFNAHLFNFGESVLMVDSAISRINAGRK